MAKTREEQLSYWKTYYQLNKERKKVLARAYAKRPDRILRGKELRASPEAKAKQKASNILKYQRRKAGFEEGNCVYCGDKCSTLIKMGLPGHGQIDHIVPKSRGGSESRDNKQLLCEHCNYAKSFFTHEEFVAHIAKIHAHLNK